MRKNKMSLYSLANRLDKKYATDHDEPPFDLEKMERVQLDSPQLHQDSLRLVKQAQHIIKSLNGPMEKLAQLEATLKHEDRLKAGDENYHLFVKSLNLIVHTYWAYADWAL